MRENKVFGAILLLAGCAIGTGMLGMPVVTGAIGFLPTCIFFGIAYVFMLVTGLLLSRLVIASKDDTPHFLTLTETILGRSGKVITFALFSLLFYAILVAYFLATGNLLVDMSQAIGITGVSFSYVEIGLFGILFFALICGIRSIDVINRYLMLGLFVCYGALLFFACPHIHVERLAASNFHGSLGVLPLLIVSFGYHNMVPSIASYLDKDEKKMRKALIIGSLIPLAIYLLWEIVMIGIVPRNGEYGFIEAARDGATITDLLFRISKDQAVIAFSQGFSFFALATSFLPVAASFCDFLHDGVKTKKLFIILAVLLPPYIIAKLYPHGFLIALSYFGGSAAVALFGIVPSLMALKTNLISKVQGYTLLLVAIIILVVTLFHDLGKT